MNQKYFKNDMFNIYYPKWANQQIKDEKEQAEKLEDQILKMIVNGTHQNETLLDELKRANQDKCIESEIIHILQNMRPKHIQNYYKKKNNCKHLT